MRQRDLLSILISFLSIFRIIVTAKDGLLRRKTEAEDPPSLKNHVHLTVVNRRHPKQETDTGIGDVGGFGARIIGGDAVDPLEYPYFVDLGGCGATLIAPRVVLSAGKTIEWSS